MKVELNRPQLLDLLMHEHLPLIYVSEDDGVKVGDDIELSYCEGDTHYLTDYPKHKDLLDKKYEVESIRDIGKIKELKLKQK